MLCLPGLIDRFANFAKLARKRIRQCLLPRGTRTRRLRSHPHPPHNLHDIPLRTSRQETGEKEGEELEFFGGQRKGA